MSRVSLMVLQDVQGRDVALVPEAVVLIRPMVSTSPGSVPVCDVFVATLPIPVQVPGTVREVVARIEGPR